jgi:hypothetical protein
MEAMEHRKAINNDQANRLLGTRFVCKKVVEAWAFRPLVGSAVGATVFGTSTTE